MSTADLATLLRKTHITSHDEILKTANIALKKSKTDTAAHNARIIALLYLDRFEDAVRAFDEAGESLKKERNLEYAYALYKAGQLEKAESIASAALKKSDGDRGMKHVFAQTTYRLEKFDKAAPVYSDLVDDSPAAVREGSDLRINSAAVDAQLEWSGKGHLVPEEKKKPTNKDLEAFESAYNAACGAIARGELGKGEVLLRRARDLCLASEDLSEEEKSGEMVPITAQMVYVLLRHGKPDEAKKAMETAEVDESADEATKWLLKVNEIVASGGGANPFLTHRFLNTGPKLLGNDSLFSYQNDILKQDTIVTDLLSAKYAGVIRSTEAVFKNSSESATSASHASLSVLNAAAHAKSQSSKAGLKAVLPLLEKRPNDVGLLLTVVQLYLLTNNTGSAISLLESFFARLEQSKSDADSDVRFAPGLIGILVSLYKKQGRSPASKDELAKAASYWRSRRKADSAVHLSVPLLRAAGTALLESGNKEDAKAAAEIFQDLHDINPDDRANAAGLIAALALTNPSSISAKTLDSLTPSARLVSDIDASALEDAGIPRLASAPAVTVGKKRPARAVAAGAAKKKVRISKKRMPKDFVEGKEMDKERWLPLRDRSYWRPKGKKGKKRDAGLTQGGAVEEAKPAASGGPAQGGGGGGAKKKKKGKGGKW